MWSWCLCAVAAATVAESAAGEQQDYEDDEEDREHRHLPGLGWVGLAHAYLRFLFVLRPVRVCATLSTALFTEALAWSTRPSFFRCLSPVSAPVASFTRPLALSMCLSVMNAPDLGEGASGRVGASGERGRSAARSVRPRSRKRPRRCPSSQRSRRARCGS